MQPDRSKKDIPLSDSAVDPSGSRRDQSAPTTVRLPPQIDIFNLKGFRCRYSVAGAAASLWQRENTLVRGNDAPSAARSRARRRRGNFRMPPTQEELQDFLTRLRRDGLDGQMDWLGLAAELKSFQDTPADTSSSREIVWECPTRTLKRSKAIWTFLWNNESTHTARRQRRQTPPPKPARTVSGSKTMTPIWPRFRAAHAPKAIPPPWTLTADTCWQQPGSAGP